VLVALALLLASSVHAQPYVFTELRGNGHLLRPSAYGINNLGDIVGATDDANGVAHATLWHGGRVIDLGASAPHVPALALAINDQGQVAGIAKERAMFWAPVGGPQRAWLGTALGINQPGQIAGTENGRHPLRAVVGSQGRFRRLPLLPGTEGSAGYGINDRGEVAGLSERTDGTVVATIWRDSQPEQLPGLGGDSEAMKINKHGQAIGSDWQLGRSIYQYALRWDDGQMVVLDSEPLGAVGRDINASGVAVGYAIGGSSWPGTFAVLWNGTARTDLNDFLPADYKAAGWSLSSAEGINDAGWIVGYMYNNFDLSIGAWLLSLPPASSASANRLGSQP
jgi:probable HAF family extracellular repeat protein